MTIKEEVELTTMSKKGLRLFLSKVNLLRLAYKQKNKKVKKLERELKKCQEQQDNQVEELKEVFDNHKIDYTTSRSREIRSIEYKIDKIFKVKK